MIDNMERQMSQKSIRWNRLLLSFDATTIDRFCHSMLQQSIAFVIRCYNNRPFLSFDATTIDRFCHSMLQQSTAFLIRWCIDDCKWSIDEWSIIDVHPIDRSMTDRSIDDRHRSSMIAPSIDRRSSSMIVSSFDDDRSIIDRFIDRWWLLTDIVASTVVDFG
jgi:hypothetical protein